MVEERLQIFDAEFVRRIAGEAEIAQLIAIVVDAGMAPRPDDQVHHVAGGVLRLDGAIDGRGTIAVFLVPLADDQHGRHAQRTLGHPLVDGDVRPRLVIGRMFEDQLVERILVHAVLAGVIAHRAVVEIARIVVARAVGGAAAIALGRRLLDDIVHLGDAEGAVVEGVVADPGVDHRALRHHGLNRRVRVDFGHQGGEAEIGRADDPNLAIGFRDVFGQPLDRVVCVGRFIDLGRVAAGADDRARHDEVALGAIHAADVLIDADIVVIDELGVHRRQHFSQVRALVARGRALGVVGRTRQQDRAVVRALLEEDDGIELHPVAHRDHHFATDIVHLCRVDRLIAGDNVGRHRRNRAGRGGCGRFLGFSVNGRGQQQRQQSNGQ